MHSNFRQLSLANTSALGCIEKENRSYQVNTSVESGAKAKPTYLVEKIFESPQSKRDSPNKSKIPMFAGMNFNTNVGLSQSFNPVVKLN